MGVPAEYIPNNNGVVHKNFFSMDLHKIHPQDLHVLAGDKYTGRCSTFQSAMKMTIVVGQLFALNPVLGVLEIDSGKLRFRYISARCIYTVISIALQSVFVGYCLYSAFKGSNNSLSTSTSILFYSSTSLTTILFLRIASQWPALCRHISKTEATDPNHDETLIRKCNFTCVLILSLALLEHILSDIAGIAVTLDCHPGTNVYESFVTTAYPWIFQHITYNHFLGGLTVFINLQCTFNWNFSDVFVICISFYLTARLDQINKRILNIKGKYMSSALWRAIREDYCRVTQLVRKVDGVIGGIVFISFANNLYFICVQLLHTLEDGLKGTPVCRSRLGGPMRGYEHAVYFVYSFVFLMSRSLAVSLIAARVHSAAIDAAPSLYEVPSPVYCIEVQRFIDQINGNTVSLSGLKFFNVKRGLVLSIAGTIVTYELVLIQFTGVTPSTYPTEATTNSTDLP